MLWGMCCFLNEISFGQSQNINVCLGQPIRLNPTNTGAFAYSWDTHSSLNATNIQNPIATPTQTTTYKVVSYTRTNNNLVKNGDFELDNNGDFDSEYIFSAPVQGFDQGNYGIGINPKLYNNAFSNCTDHTGGTSGKMLIADGASGRINVAPNAIVWKQTVNVSKNTAYAFSTFITNIASGDLSSLKFSINGIPIGQPVLSSPGLCNWKEFYVVWNSENQTTAEISIAEGTGATRGNDFALDDISFYSIVETSETIEVTVLPPPAIPVVQGVSELCINKTTQLTSSATGGTWKSNNATVATIDTDGRVTPISAGNASFVYILSDFCKTESVPFNITVNEPANLHQIIGTDKLTIGQQAPLTINLPGGKWMSSDDTIVEISPDGTVKGLKNGEADITYTLDGLCPSVSLPFKITVIQKDDLYTPNAFTPNGDGNNDEFRIYGSLIDKIELNIFNQWGELVFTSTQLTSGWLGDYKGEKQPAGVYVFTAKIKMLDGKELIRKGAINLIR